MPSISIHDLLGIHNLADFGNTRDAFVQAVARAATLGGIVFVPPGTYVLASDFTVSSGVTVILSAGVTLSGAGSLLPGTGVVIDYRDGLKVNGASLASALVEAAAAWTAKRFVAANRQPAAVDSITVIGVSPAAVAAGADGVIVSSGVQAVTADAPLANSDPVKVGVGGRATKHTTAQHTLQTTITGETTAFTQPAAADTLEILQAADVAADRGRGIVIEGSNAGGVAVTETITLNATNSSTPVAGTTTFTKVSAVYTADGAVLGAQNVTVRRVTGGATVCTLAGASSELGADIPAQSQEAYCNELTVTGPNLDATFITVVGINSADAVVRERVQLNGASPSVVTTTTVFRYVNRICLGEFTNAGTGNVKTNATTDTAGMKCGVVVEAAIARGDDAIVLLKPNA
jgi:hypothetical protein